MGLGSVWVCYFKPSVLKTEFNLPSNLEPINILAIGYADTSHETVLPSNRHNKMRLPLSATVSFEEL